MHILPRMEARINLLTITCMRERETEGWREGSETIIVMIKLCCDYLFIGVHQSSTCASVPVPNRYAGTQFSVHTLLSSRFTLLPFFSPVCSRSIPPHLIDSLPRLTCPIPSYLYTPPPHWQQLNSTKGASLTPRQRFTAVAMAPNPYPPRSRRLHQFFFGRYTPVERTGSGVLYTQCSRSYLAQFTQ